MPLKRPPTESQPRPPKAIDLHFAESENFDLLFNPNTDLDPKVVKALFDELQRYRNNDDCGIYLPMASDLSVVFNDDAMHIELTDKEDHSSIHHLEHFQSSKEWISFSCTAANPASICPS